LVLIFVVVVVVFLVALFLVGDFVVVGFVVVIKDLLLQRPMLKHAGNFYLHLLSSVPQIIIIIVKLPF
jgi:hypothetical protein